MAEFFYMGGYAFYVWMSYGLVALVLILNIVIPRQQHKSIVSRLATLTNRNQLKQ
jgi:heme exporter protein D